MFNQDPGTAQEIREISHLSNKSFNFFLEFQLVHPHK